MELVRKLFGSPGIDEVIINESLRSPVMIAQNKIALPTIVYFRLWDAGIMVSSIVKTAG